MHVLVNMHNDSSKEAKIPILILVNPTGTQILGHGVWELR